MMKYKSRLGKVYPLVALLPLSCGLYFVRNCTVSFIDLRTDTVDIPIEWTNRLNMTHPHGISLCVNAKHLDVVIIKLSSLLSIYVLVICKIWPNMKYKENVLYEF